MNTYVNLASFSVDVNPARIAVPADKLRAFFAAERGADVALAYFDEYNTADDHYFGSVWTQYDRGFVAIDRLSGTRVLLVGPEIAQFGTVNTPAGPVYFLGELLVPGLDYPNIGRLTEQVVVEGDVLMTDVCPKCRGYCALIGAPLPIGTPSQARSTYNASTLDVYSRIEAAHRTGMHSVELFAMSRVELAKRALADKQIYGAIHSMGLNEAESTFLSGNTSWAFESGMVVAIDLAAFGDLLGRIRIESGYPIGENGAENLSSVFDDYYRTILQKGGP